MIVYSHKDYPQTSPQWWELRCGKVTASEMNRIITASKAGPSQGMMGYAAELANDLKLQSPEYFSQKGRPINKHQEYGRDMEEQARQDFAIVHHCKIEQVGFIT